MLLQVKFVTSISQYIGFKLLILSKYYRSIGSVLVAERWKSRKPIMQDYA